MGLCWAAEPDERLSFPQIVECFEEYLTELRNYLNPNVDPYSHWNMSVAKEVTVTLPQLLSKSEDGKPKGRSVSGKQASDPASRSINVEKISAMFALGDGEIDVLEC